jgi:hypothetical protein
VIIESKGDFNARSFHNGKGRGIGIGKSLVLVSTEPPPASTPKPSDAHRNSLGQNRIEAGKAPLLKVLFDFAA